MTDFKADIPLDLARAAHRGTSHDPDMRGLQEIDSYTRTLLGCWSTLARLATSQEKLDLLRTRFDTFHAGYRDRYLSMLRAKSQCISTMIAGPSGFPARSAQAASRRANARMDDLLAYQAATITSISRALRPEAQPVRADAEDAVERLETKIAELRARREKMTAVNKVIRSVASRGYEAQIEALAALGISLTMAAQLLTPDFAGRVGYADYELANSRSELMRLERRLETVRAAKATPVEEIVPIASGMRVEVDSAANRVRIFFPGKPAAETIAALKAHAFRWTPSRGCWQAYGNPRAVSFARTTALAVPAEGAS